MLTLLVTLAFYIDGHRYVAASNLSADACEATLASTRSDPDSFRRGSGFYVCEVDYAEAPRK